jgi:hypothetical protein
MLEQQDVRPVFIEQLKPNALQFLKEEEARMKAEEKANRPNLNSRFFRTTKNQPSDQHPVELAYEKIIYLDSLRKNPAVQSVMRLRPETYISTTLDEGFVYPPLNELAVYTDGVRIRSVGQHEVKFVDEEILTRFWNEGASWARRYIPMIARAKKSKIVSDFYRSMKRRY